MYTKELEKGWSYVYAILYGYTAVQGISEDTVFNGLLAEFPTILDSFSTVPQALLYRDVGRGWGVVNAFQKFITDVGWAQLRSFYAENTTKSC